MRIKVTQEHWDRGKAASASHIARCRTCVLAQAISDAGLPDPHVYPCAVWAGRERAVLPLEAQNVVKAFDGYDHDPFEIPFEFDIDLKPYEPAPTVPVGPSREGA